MTPFAAFRRWRAQYQLQRYAIPDALWNEAFGALPFLHGWPTTRLQKLRDLTVFFLCEKNIIGAHDFQVLPFHRVVVAMQACVPILELGLRQYDAFQTVVLYPDEFITGAEWEDEFGVVHQDDEAMMGEAMMGGPVVLSWPDALDPTRGAAQEGDAVPLANVVIHEFVHQIDMRNGDANGFPELPGTVQPERWKQVFADAYADFSARVTAEEETEIDPYAAESPAEFFAVISETFFVALEMLETHYPDVAALLMAFYRYRP
jgi:Uncharacterized protein conserved in bacteria